MMHRVLSSLLALLAPAIAVAAPPAVTAVAYSPKDGLVAFGQHGEVRVFDAAKGEARAALKATGRCTALAFSANKMARCRDW